MDSTQVAAADGSVINVWRSSVRHEGPTCLLIHGTADGAYVWRHVEDSLLDVCHVVSVDLRGHGDSAWSRTGHYTLHQHIADVHHVIQKLELDPVVLIGHSLGGQIAIHLAVQLRQRLAGMMVVDFGPQLVDSAREQARLNFIRSLRLYSSVEEYESWLFDSRPLLTRAMARYLAQSSLRSCEGGFRLKVDPALADEKPDDPKECDWLWQALRTITCPVMIVRGAGSAVLPMRVAERMQRTVADGRLEVVENAGHAVMLDSPLVFSRIARTFLTRIARKPAGSAVASFGATPPDH